MTSTDTKPLHPTNDSSSPMVQRGFLVLPADEHILKWGDYRLLVLHGRVMIPKILTKDKEKIQGCGRRAETWDDAFKGLQAISENNRVEFHGKTELFRKLQETFVYRLYTSTGETATCNWGKGKGTEMTDVVSVELLLDGSSVFQMPVSRREGPARSRTEGQHVPGNRTSTGTRY